MLDLARSRPLESLFQMVEPGSFEEKWLLHEVKRKNVPSRGDGGALMMIDFETLYLQSYESQFNGTILSVVEGHPVLFMDEFSTEWYSIGSAWVFPTGIPGTPRSSRAAPTVKVMRYMRYIVNERVATVLTTRVSEDEVWFSLVAEASVRENRAINGIIDTRRRSCVLREDIMHTRNCPSCVQRGLFCECNGQELSSFFAEEANKRRIMLRRAAKMTGTFNGNVYVSSWLGATWSMQGALRTGKSEPATLKMTCSVEGATLDLAMNFIYQCEIQALHSPRASNFFDRLLMEPDMFDNVAGVPGAEVEELTPQRDSYSGDERSPSLRALPSWPAEPAAAKRSSFEGEAESNSASQISGSSGADGEFVCKICSQVFTRKYGLRRHILGVHEKRRNYECTECRKRFSQQGHLNEHIRAYHTGQGFPCTACSKVFGVASKLQRHYDNVHLNMHKFACTLCSKRYKDSSNLKLHMSRVHSVN